MSDTFVGHSKSGKASFEHIYDLGDPREYFEVLGRLDYRAPQNGCRIFSTLLEEKRRVSGGKKLKVVDLCCSYGLNGALLKHDVTFDDLYERYGSEELAGLSSGELAEADLLFYRGRRRRGAPAVVGVDVAKNAISYALRAGLLDAGFVANLEEDEPADGLAEALAGADLLTVTGGIGYVWTRTFDRLLGLMRARGGVPWVATFPLRMVDYAPIAGVLSKHGLVTEKLHGRTFAQRRFADTEEREYVLRELEEMSIDAEGKEAAGYYYTDLYLSRPEDEASRKPIEELIS